jgi:hypothetical protein
MVYAWWRRQDLQPTVAMVWKSDHRKITMNVGLRGKIDIHLCFGPVFTVKVWFG